MKLYTVKENYIASENTIVDVINLSNFVDVSKYELKNAWINVGGYQSWNPGFEVEPGKKQDALTCHLIKGWNRYLVFPESKYKISKNIVLAQFVSYVRWNDFYLFFVSAGNIEETLPPVQFVYNRKENTVSIEIYDKGKAWNSGDTTAKIEIFTAESYFEAKDKLKNLFNKINFEQIQHLGTNPAGWESWYNHYANINEQLITENLNSLVSKEKIIPEDLFTSKIFQIDDGWEQALGEWEIDSQKFPNGLSTIVQQIEKNNYIPGLWIAPFIIDSRCKTARIHPQWILRDEKNNPIVSGFNPLWGEKGNFYCLDLSNPEVIEHLNNVMEKVINDWGFRYIKLDFLYAGMFYGKFRNPDAAYKIYTKAISTITSRKENSKGQKVCYLGCGMPFESSFKYLPLARIGCDTLEHWENKKLRMIRWNGRNEAYLNVKDTIGHALWDKTFFANDPDVIFIREDNCSLTKKEKYLITFINTVFGSQLMYSDDVSKVSTKNEKAFAQEVIELVSKYKNVDFGIKQITKDKYKIFDRNNKITGEIDLGKTRGVTINENF